jgi:ATP/maltotriose-dependent transcriptional regulator MalT
LDQEHPNLGATRRPTNETRTTMTIRALTDREGEVFRLIAAGLSNEQIAVQIETKVDNAKIHARHIFDKLGVNNRAEAVAVGFIEGILDREDIDSLREQLKQAREAQTATPADQ